MINLSKSICIFTETESNLMETYAVHSLSVFTETESDLMETYAVHFK